MTALVTENNDLKIVDNNFLLSVDNSDQEIEQRIRQNLQFFLGEWFLDTTIGIPYFQMVFVKGVAPSLIEAVFKDAILETPGVSSLVEFRPIEYESSTRQLTVDFTVRTINNNNLQVGFAT